MGLRIITFFSILKFVSLSQHLDKPGLQMQVKDAEEIYGNIGNSAKTTETTSSRQLILILKIAAGWEISASGSWECQIFQNLFLF
jgi:hypothetical protein